jgi:hypothetical protein
MTKKQTPTPPKRKSRRSPYQRWLDRLTVADYEALDDEHLILEYMKQRKW